MIADFFSNVADVFGAARYSEYAMCLTNDRVMMFLYVWAGVIIALASLAIFATLVVYRDNAIAWSIQTRILYATTFLLLFISSIVKTLVIFSGMYRLDVVIYGMLAAIMSATAAITFRDVAGINSRSEAVTTER